MDPINPLLSSQQRTEKINCLFSELVSFLEILQNDGEINADCLTKLEELQERANRRLLSHQDINHYQSEIAKCLCGAFKSSLRPQLESYWNCWARIVTNNNLEYVDIREKTNEYLSSIQEIDSMYQEILNEQPEKNNIALFAVFYIFILKVEKIEYALQKDFSKYSAHMTDCDIESMFSLGKKVKRIDSNGSVTRYVTRGRAIRDA